MQRSSGLLLHPTALSEPFGTGTIGQEAYLFVDFLARAGQHVWQVLPLGPTGYGDSPYNALSAFAGNPDLIDLKLLVANGELTSEELETAIAACSTADINRRSATKKHLLHQAAGHFFALSGSDKHTAFDTFCIEQKFWLDDFTLFMALRDFFDAQPWSAWPKDLRKRNQQALKEWQSRLAGEIRAYQYQQFAFAEQWFNLKKYANSKGVQIFGDVPIFVAQDSADVWANQHLFQLDEQGRATSVAGVPPDYFSKTGQRWGNPLYRWEAHLADNFRWWLQRIEYQLCNCDLIRIDHFRGFQACWSIPAEEKTAVNGHWEDAPGRQLFTRLLEQRKTLPIVAEDLGIITPAVEKLRDDFGFPGMKILQFAFDSGSDNPYLPENYTAHCVVYTGTHDNNTTLGWWQALDKEHQDKVRIYLDNSKPQMPWDMIRLAMASKANLCIIPMQDILGLDKTARFNTPGRATGNWKWRMETGQMSAQVTGNLLRLTRESDRIVHG